MGSLGTNSSLGVLSARQFLGKHQRGHPKLAGNAMCQLLKAVAHKLQKVRTLGTGTREFLPCLVKAPIGPPTL